MRDNTPSPSITKLTPNKKMEARQKRRLLIDMALRRVRPGTGSSHQFMRRRTATNSWPDLRTILKEIDWVIIGGVATRAYMPERMTKNLDILVSHADGQRGIRYLQDAGFKIIAQLSVPGYSLESPDGIELVMLLGDEEWAGEALATPEHDPAGYPVIPFPFLILMKMNTGRGRDFGDMTTMLGWAEDVQLAATRKVIAQYSPQDSEDLESIIYLGQQEQVTDDSLG